jgi:hypothetical protein
MRNIERYLEAIRKYAPDHKAITDAESWSADVGKERWVYVNDPPRDAVGEDGVYFTFIVRVDPATDKILRITHYRSKKRAHGDSTLPP